MSEDLVETDREQGSGSQYGGAGAKVDIESDSLKERGVGYIFGRLSSIVAAFLGLAVAAYSIFGTFASVRADRELESAMAAREFAIEAKTRDEELKKQLVDMQQRIDSFLKLPKEDIAFAQWQQLSQNIDELKIKESKLESVILENPARALEVPLLKQDIDNLKSSQQTNYLEIKDGVDRIYDINKWLLGAMAVSVVTLAVSNLLKPKEQKSDGSR